MLISPVSHVARAPVPGDNLHKKFNFPVPLTCAAPPPSDRYASATPSAATLLGGSATQTRSDSGPHKNRKATNVDVRLSRREAATRGSKQTDA